MSRPDQTDDDPLAQLGRPFFAAAEPLPEPLPAHAAPPQGPGLQVTNPGRELQGLEANMRQLGVVPAKTHREVIGSMNRATREMLERHGIVAPPNATHSQLLAVISRRLALVDFHGNAEP